MMQKETHENRPVTFVERLACSPHVPYTNRDHAITHGNMERHKQKAVKKFMAANGTGGFMSYKILDQIEMMK
jgi:hypothetical protein